MTTIFEKICLITELGTLTFLRGPKSLNHDPHKNVFFTINNPHYNFLLCLNLFYYDLDLNKNVCARGEQKVPRGGCCDSKKKKLKKKVYL